MQHLGRRCRLDIQNIRFLDHHVRRLPGVLVAMQLRAADRSRRVKTPYRHVDVVNMSMPPATATEAAPSSSLLQRSADSALLRLDPRAGE
jgi:hypothetical protein